MKEKLDFLRCEFYITTKVKNKITWNLIKSAGGFRGKMINRSQRSSEVGSREFTGGLFFLLLFCFVSFCKPQSNLILRKSVWFSGNFLGTETNVATLVSKSKHKSSDLQLQILLLLSIEH